MLRFAWPEHPFGHQCDLFLIFWGADWGLEPNLRKNKLGIFNANRQGVNNKESKNHSESKNPRILETSALGYFGKTHQTLWKNYEKMMKNYVNMMKNDETRWQNYEK